MDRRELSIDATACEDRALRDRPRYTSLSGDPDFLARKITAEGTEERYKHLTIYSPFAPLSVLCSYILCLVTVCPVSGSSCIVTSLIVVLGTWVVTMLKR